MASTDEYVILGAGVAGLTTALELKDRYPNSKLTIVAKFLPGDRSIEYTSPWAGANWVSVATDNGPQEGWDAITFHKFGKIVEKSPESGIQRMDLRFFFENKVKDAGVLSEGTGKIWYEELVGLEYIEKGGLPEGVEFGYDMSTWLIDVQVYLRWLQNEVLKRGIQIRRHTIEDIRDLFKSFPSAKAVFNCTGLGSYSLKGVEDKKLYPTRGQILLVENPNNPTNPLTRMYIRSPKRVAQDTTYVFPRNPGGGVVLGGCRFDNEWSGEVDLDFAEDIKRRCCKLAPELGRPEDLKVISHGVGLRPSRKGGARVEREVFGQGVVIHNYGAGGAGYQSSWGMAKNAVNLLKSPKL